MAACGSLGSINIDPEDPWKQIKSIRDIRRSPSFKQIFGELPHLKDKNQLFQNPSEPSSPSAFLDGNSAIHHNRPTAQKKQHNRSESFSSMNSDTLSICTEGLEVESLDNVNDLLNDEVLATTDNNNNNNEPQLQNARNGSRSQWGELRRSKTCRGELPPPISCIGKCGMPFVRFKSYRQDGRFILKEIRVPELLQAHRENGRLRMNLIQSDDDDEENNDM